MQRALLSSVIALGLSGVAHAQLLSPPESAATETTPVAARAPAASEEAPGFAARAIARIVLSDLKLVKSASERDYRIGAEVLELAHELDPTDQDILRLLIQAWTSAGDAERVDELNRDLLRLDPRDTVTQLAVVSSRINRLQNADARLAAYENFLGPQGASLDPAIRSRLAMDAALLKRERGDDAGFASTLATACQLDPTNKDAATLALAYFAERVPDAEGRFELLTNVLKADPFDPEVHAAMAEELASAGAVRSAERFYNTLSQLRRARGEQLTPQESAEAVVSDWNVNGAETLIRRLTDEVESARAELRARRERIAASGDLLAQVRDPMETRLSVPFERTRVIASASLGNPELVGYALTEATETIHRTITSLESIEARPEGMSEEDAASTIRSLKVERVWLRLWAGRTIDEAAAEFAELEADPVIDAATMRRMKACLDLREGLYDEASSALIELAREDVLAAVALGILAELQGRKDAAVELYTALSHRLSGSIAGAYCRTRVIQLTGRPPAPTALARKLETLADAIPRSLEAMISDPRRFVEVRAETVGSETRLLDKVEIKFVIQNTSRYPLAIGPDQPINSRFLLAPVVDIGVQQLAVPGLQEVVWLNRRLRLMPGERLEATVWANPGILGGILQRLGSSSARVRWRVIQGFRLDQQGVYQSGALCLSTETATLSRPVSSRSIAEFSSLVGWIEKGTTREMAESLLSFMERLGTPTPGQPQITKADVDALVAAVVSRYRSADRAEKAILMAHCPSSLLVPPMAALDMEAARESDEGLLKYFLGMRIPSADSPLLAADAWSSRPAVQSFADLVRARLADGERTFATIGMQDPASPANAASGASSTPQSR